MADLERGSILPAWLVGKQEESEGGEANAKKVVVKMEVEGGQQQQQQQQPKQQQPQQQEEEVAEDEDLYGDLDSIHGSIQTQRLSKLYASATKEIASLRTERDEMKQQISLLQAQKQTLETNLVSVYSTASHEVERKNKRIADLQRDVIKLQSSALR